MNYVLIIIAIALVFDFINGMHDSANSIATVVSTRVLSPFQAVFWASLVPCDQENAAAEASWARRNHRSTEA